MLNKGPPHRHCFIFHLKERSRCPFSYKNTALHQTYQNNNIVYVLEPHPAMTTLSTADDSSMEALEALLTFRHSITTSAPSPSVHPEIPVPNPLNPLLPHVIEGDAVPVNHSTAHFRPRMLKISMPNTSASSRVPSVPNPLNLYAGGSVAKRSLTHLYSAKHQAIGSSDQLLFSHAAAGDTVDSRDNAIKPPVKGTPNIHDAVRTDKIQAALNSMPQRGKKRRNLNDEERLELTRTRNREHAKCTRYVSNFGFIISSDYAWCCVLYFH